MQDTFKIRLTNEPKDEHLKMNLLYHLPMTRFAEVVDYLEKVAPRNPLEKQITQHHEHKDR